MSWSETELGARHLTRLLFLGLIVSAVVLISVLGLIRTRRLQERFALLWILAAVGVSFFALWPGALNRLARVTGIAYGPSALFLLASIFVLSVLLQSTVMISRLSQETQQLAQHVALLDERLRSTESGSANDEPATTESLTKGQPPSMRL